jgi:hypothetical protein
MEYETIRYELEEHVAVLTYDRPRQRDAVSRRMSDELHHAWRRFRDANAVCGYTRRAEAFKPERRPRRARAALEHRRRRRDDGQAAAGRRLGDGDGAPARSRPCPRGRSAPNEETMIRNFGRTFEERLRQKAEIAISMFWRKDSHPIVASALKRGETPEWPHHGL